jgi:hypothetical protein
MLVACACAAEKPSPTKCDLVYTRLVGKEYVTTRVPALKGDWQPADVAGAPWKVITVAVQEDDPHAGQPDHCSNAHANNHKCECQRATKCKHEQAKEEDSKCQTYCRKEACKCLDPCTT